jgi:hypothetical protein
MHSQLHDICTECTHSLTQNLPSRTITLGTRSHSAMQVHDICTECTHSLTQNLPSRTITLGTRSHSAMQVIQPLAHSLTHPLPAPSH